MSDKPIVGRVVNLGGIPIVPRVAKEGRREALIRLQDASRADAIRAAERRVADAALNGTIVNMERCTVLLAFAEPEEAAVFDAALDDLRRLKGEG